MSFYVDLTSKQRGEGSDPPDHVILQRTSPSFRPCLLTLLPYSSSPTPIWGNTKFRKMKGSSAFLDLYPSSLRSIAGSTFETGSNALEDTGFMICCERCC
jgi:hypothetical protein